MKSNYFTVVYLCNKYNADTNAFLEELHTKLNVNVVQMCDSDEGIIYSEKVSVMHFPDSVCREHGYINSNIGDSHTHIRKNPIALDKALYYLCELDKSDFVFIIEEDCFVPFPLTIQNLFDNYGKSDLVVANNFYNDGSAMDWHWSNVYPLIQPPYYYSMVCAVGVSRKMLDCIKKYKEENNTLLYCEVMFNTLAMQNNLNVICAFELLSVVWMGDWGIDEFLLLPDNIFHPRKDIENHKALRVELTEGILSRRKPSKNRLPPFITDLM